MKRGEILQMNGGGSEGVELAQIQIEKAIRARRADGSHLAYKRHTKSFLPVGRAVGSDPAGPTVKMLTPLFYFWGSSLANQMPECRTRSFNERA